MAKDLHHDIDLARKLLIHALAMLNDLPTLKYRGSAVFHAIAAAVVLGLGKDEQIQDETLKLLELVRERRK